jgi:hypothetical protein
VSSRTTPDPGHPAPTATVQAAVDRLCQDDWRDLHPYRKWAGAHWRLLSLIDLGAADDPRLGPLFEHDLAWLTGTRHRARIRSVTGRVRQCASQEGAAVLVAAASGRADDRRVGRLVADLVTWQWGDGGWNCDPDPAAHHSSLHETWLPLLGLHAWADATADRAGARAARAAADTAGDLLVAHRLVLSRHGHVVIDPDWLDLHWPPYWHHDVLTGVRCLAALGRLGEVPRAEAWLDAHRTADGRWHTSGRRWWRPPGRTGSGVDVVDWSALADDVVTAQVAATRTAPREDVRD